MDIQGDSIFQHVLSRYEALFRDIRRRSSDKKKTTIKREKSVLDIIYISHLLAFFHTSYSNHIVTFLLTL